MDSDQQLLELGAIVFGLTEVIKTLLPKEYQRALAPLISVLLGAIGNIYLNGYSPENLVFGLAMGLAATGLYKAARNTLGTPSPLPVHVKSVDDGVTVTKA